mmetsp:Transcript_10399/g.8943  ORF Transcript_10399/g.8943 Transcript_10399/m.8943 type:complete len:80 (+) Transcript_10399:328-567(+)
MPIKIIKDLDLMLSMTAMKSTLNAYKLPTCKADKLRWSAMSHTKVLASLFIDHVNKSKVLGQLGIVFVYNAIFVAKWTF